MNAVLDERDELLKTIAKHIVDAGYRYGNHEELKGIISHKLGHEVTQEKELKTVEKHIKEIRAGR